MANKTDNRFDKGNGRSAFSVLAMLTGVVLIAAAAVLYVQYGRTAGSSPAALSALSQEVSGHAGAILADREAAETIRSAAALVNERVPEMLTASDALLEASGSTGVIRQFQQRASEMQQSLNALAAGEDEAGAVAEIAEDLAFLKEVTGALSGAETTLDVAPLPAGARETALQPVIAQLEEIETRTREAVAAADDLGNSAASLAALAASAEALSGAARSGSAWPGAAILQHPLLPPALVGTALLLLAILAYLHSRTAVFERAAKVQAEQNERNQQDRKSVV